MTPDCMWLTWGGPCVTLGYAEHNPDLRYLFAHRAKHKTYFTPPITVSYQFVVLEIFPLREEHAI